MNQYIFNKNYLHRTINEKIANIVIVDINLLRHACAERENCDNRIYIFMMNNVECDMTLGAHRLRHTM